MSQCHCSKYSSPAASKRSAYTTGQSQRKLNGTFLSRRFFNEYTAIAAAAKHAVAPAMTALSVQEKAFSRCNKQATSKTLLPTEVKYNFAL